MPRDSDPAIILINSIIEWAKDLCFTSCGNYLCQQLLERGDVEDKLVFIDKIKSVSHPIYRASIADVRDDLVNIASDKFGTHVLCKAVAVDELEVSLVMTSVLDSGTRANPQAPILSSLMQHGIFDSLKTGTRRLWREVRWMLLDVAQTHTSFSRSGVKPNNSKFSRRE